MSVVWLALACVSQRHTPDAPVNRLATEGSAYLRQHADEPVAWYPWGAEAFDRARALDRPVLVSIGYATCHWCRVMARESFSDPEIAAVLNERFVAVKVDREERPDIDDVYQHVVRTLGGSGGWPTTVVVLPDGTPVFAGGYLPARDGDRGAGRGFLTVLRQLADGWASDRETLVAEAARNSREIRDAAAARPPGTVPGPHFVTAATDRLLALADREYGGFGTGAKFPNVVRTELALAEAVRRADPELQTEVVRTLDAMADGALHDLLGGGFHRYTTDRAWRVPHFEKMTSDNAQLVRLYLAAWQAWDEPRYRDVARRTIRALDTFALPDGGYGTARGADSADPDGVEAEGRYYTWTADEIRAVLGDDATAGFHLAGPGIDGRHALNDAGDPPLPEPLRAKLLAARALRPAPLLDEKHVAAVTALVVSALARAAFVLDDPELSRRALDTAAVLESLRSVDGRLRRASTSPAVGVLDDQVLAVEAWLDLFELTADRVWLDRATSLLALVEAHYADPAGGWFRTPDDGEALLFRPGPGDDGADPSGASVAVQSFLRLGALTGDPAWLERADRALGAYRGTLETRPTALTGMAEALARRHRPPPEIVLSWPDGADPHPLLDVVRETYVPGRILVQGSNAALAALDLPLLADRTSTDRPTAWVCESGVCQQPATDPDALRSAIDAAYSRR